MRVTDKLVLIDKIGRELQARFKYPEIDAFFAEFGIPPPKAVIANSRWLYSKAALSNATNDIIIKIAKELDLLSHSTFKSDLTPPKNWINTNEFRLFISHISESKDKATKLKTCLSQFGINAFVAHEDIHPTLDWQVEVERALFSMDAFLALHTLGFSQSYWTQQEIGFAVGRGTKIISLKFDEDPTGFISKQQALPRRKKDAKEISREINSLLLGDPQTCERLKKAKEAIFGPCDDEIPF